MYVNMKTNKQTNTAGMMSRDSRRVERKKIGQKKARKKFQWVKR
jgi:ribosomal protein S9